MSNTRILCLSMRFIYGFLTAEPDLLRFKRRRQIFLRTTFYCGFIICKLLLSYLHSILQYFNLMFKDFFLLQKNFISLLQSAFTF